MTLWHPNNSTLRRFVLALLGLLVVAGKAFGLALTSEDIALTLGFLSTVILGSNWRSVTELKTSKPAEAAP